MWLHFRNLHQILNILEKHMSLIDFVFPKLQTRKTKSYKRLKSPASEDPSTSSMVNLSKQCWNLHHSNFIMFSDYFQVNWVGKCLSYWYAKSWDLTHWLAMESILFLTETIYRYQFSCNYIRKKKYFLGFWQHFWNLN